MRKSIALFGLAAILSSSLALAAPPKSNKKPAKPGKSATKVVDVWHCPMTGEEIKDHKMAAAGPVVGNYRVHFCCGSCPAGFAKLSDKDQKAKVADAHKKDTETAKKGKG